MAAKIDRKQHRLSDLALDALGEIVEYADADGIASFAAFLPDERVLARWPSFPKTALPEAGRIAYGRGRDRARARLTALAEFVELASICRWEGDLDSQAHVTDMRTGAQQLWPCDALYIDQSDTSAEKGSAGADSAGCACGDSDEAALLSALLEAVEHDATARWWYGERLRPRIPLDILDGDVGRALVGRGRHSRLIDITTDVAIPCVAALSCDPDGTRVALGFAAKSSFEEASLSAVLEMLQSEFALLTAIENEMTSPAQSEWLTQVNCAEGFLSGVETPFQALNSIPTGTETLIDRILNRGSEVYMHDHTRLELGIPVIRAICPGLCRASLPISDTNPARLLAGDARDLSAPARSPNRTALLI